MPESSRGLRQQREEQPEQRPGRERQRDHAARMTVPPPVGPRLTSPIATTAQHGPASASADGGAREQADGSGTSAPVTAVIGATTAIAPLARPR